MVTMRQIKTGAAQFFEEALLSGMTGLEKVLVGTGIAMYIGKLDGIVANAAEMPAIKALDIVHGDSVDLDTVYQYLREELNKEGAVSLDLPVIKMKMNVDDLDKLVRKIREA